MTKLEKQQRLLQQLTINCNLLNSEIKEKFTYHTLEYNSQSFLLVIFKISKEKPIYLKAHKTIEGLQEFINNHQKTIADLVEKEKLRLASVKENQENIQKGTILYASWGYEQTNINFYLVLEKRNSILKLQEIGSNRIHESQDYGTCSPNSEQPIGEAFEKRLSKYSSIKINDVYSASVYNGEKLYWSAWY